jgi:hypothetical protein
MSRRGSVLIRRSIPASTQKTSATAEARTKEGHFRPLPKEFRRDGFLYRQIAREGNAAITNRLGLAALNQIRLTKRFVSAGAGALRSQAAPSHQPRFIQIQKLGG